MSTWPSIYTEILDHFGWDEADDRASAETLQPLVSPGAWRHVGTELKHRPVATVVGCSAELDSVVPADLQGIVLAADGAAARLREIDAVPRVVVTDLDGSPDALGWAADAGASMVVHAHGHNEDRLPMVRDLGPFVAGTYQSTPDPALDPLRNLGGFTDGDRAVALCEAYQVRHVRLVAFDLDAPPSRHTHESHPATKPIKLAFARRIIEDIAATTSMTIESVS